MASTLVGFFVCCLPSVQSISPSLMRRDGDDAELVVTSGGKIGMHGDNDASRIVLTRQQWPFSDNASNGTNDTMTTPAPTTPAMAPIDSNGTDNSTQSVDATNSSSDNSTPANATNASSDTTIVTNCCTNGTNGSNGTNGTNGTNCTDCSDSGSDETASGTVPAEAGPAPTPAPCAQGWVCDTYVTGFWDCCKPSCAWPGHGNVTSPPLACTGTGFSIENHEQLSVCDAGAQNAGVGGLAGACPDWQPWAVTADLSYGVASMQAGSADILQGDVNCGQCYELVFEAKHYFSDHMPGNMSGGADPSIVDKRMIVQVINVGHDVTGTHSFELYIPGAGQQGSVDVFGKDEASGCTRQYNDVRVNDFDCGQRYGGCNVQNACDQDMPNDLRAGCNWRFDWFKWISKGSTNNPYVKFRRVKCPAELTAKTQSKPLDDDDPSIPGASPIA